MEDLCFSSKVTVVIFLVQRSKHFIGTKMAIFDSKVKEKGFLKAKSVVQSKQCGDDKTEDKRQLKVVMEIRGPSLMNRITGTVLCVIDLQNNLFFVSVLYFSWVQTSGKPLLIDLIFVSCNDLYLCKCLLVPVIVSC